MIIRLHSLQHYQQNIKLVVQWCIAHHPGHNPSHFFHFLQAGSCTILISLYMMSHPLWGLASPSLLTDWLNSCGNTPKPESLMPGKLFHTVSLKSFNKKFRPQAVNWQFSPPGLAGWQKASSITVIFTLLNLQICNNKWDIPAGYLNLPWYNNHIRQGCQFIICASSPDSPLVCVCTLISHLPRIPDKLHSSHMVTLHFCLKL